MSNIISIGIRYGTRNASYLIVNIVPGELFIAVTAVEPKVTYSYRRIEASNVNHQIEQLQPGYSLFQNAWVVKNRKYSIETRYRIVTTDKQE